MARIITIIIKKEGLIILKFKQKYCIDISLQKMDIINVIEPIMPYDHYNITEYKKKEKKKRR